MIPGIFKVLPDGKGVEIRTGAFATRDEVDQMVRKIQEIHASHGHVDLTIKPYDSPIMWRKA